MRIAIWHNQSSGGAKRVLYNQVRWLLTRGHEIEAWCPPTADRDFMPLNTMITEHIVPLARGEYRSSPLTAREVLRDRRDDIEAMDQHCQDCADEISRAHFDILLAHCCTYFRATAIGRRVALPSVLYAEPDRSLFEQVSSQPWAAPVRREGWWSSAREVHAATRDLLTVQSRRIQVREEIANAKGFSRLLAYSCFTREAILRAYGLDSTVCFPGINTDEFVDQGGVREAFLMSVGAVCPEKNLEFVIESVALLPDRRPLVWVADDIVDGYLADVLRCADSLGVEFTLHHRVSQEQLVGLLNRAELMLYAPQLEPLGLAPLEAAACGLPAVAVAEGGVRETVVSGQTGLLTSASVHSFADAIAQMLADPRRLGSMRVAAREHVLRNWSEEAAMMRLEDQLADVVRLAGVNG